MSNKSKSATPHWIMRLLGAESATFSLDKNGLNVKTKSGDRYVVLTESLAGSVDCIDGVIFSKLVLKTDKGTKKFRGLSKRDALQLFAWLRQFWIEQLAPVVTETAHQIKALLDKGYLRSSRLIKVQELAQNAVEKFVTTPDKSWATNVDVKVFKYVFDVSRWDTGDVESWRQHYVDYMTEKFSDYFNSVESNPLTPRQCEACMVDEDHNLAEIR